MQRTKTNAPISADISFFQKEAFRDFACLLMLSLFALILIPSLLFGKTLYWGDIILYFSPMQAFAQEHLKNGVIPLWNPHTFSGQPFVGNPQMSVFYPTSALLFFLPGWMALNSVIVIHLALCGMFSYLLLRRWTDRRVSALCGSAVYMAGGCLMGRVQFPPVIQTAAYFPLILYFIDRWIVNHRLVRHSEASNDAWAAPGLSISIALSLFAAHTQTAYIIYLCAILFSIHRITTVFNFDLKSHFIAKSELEITEKNSLLERLGGFARRIKLVLNRIAKTGVFVPALELASFAIMGLLIAGVYLFPTFQLLKESPRERLTLFQANRFYMDFPHLMGLIFPHFAGHPATGDYFARGNAWEPAIFVGWVPLVLVWQALIKSHRKKLSVFWGIVSLAGVWLAMGVNLGLFTMAFYLVPGLASFHDPARFLLWTSFGLSVLTATGMDAILKRHIQMTRLQLTCLILSIFAPLWWYGKEWNPTIAHSSLTRRAAQLEVLKNKLQSGRVSIMGSNLVWKRFVDNGYNDWSAEEEGRVLQELQDSLTSNQEVLGKLDSSSGYEPVPVVSMGELEGLSRQAERRNEPNVSRLLSVMNVSILLQKKPLGITDARLEPIASTEKNPVGSARPDRTTLNFWLNRDRLPRAWLVRKTRNVVGLTRVAAAVAAPEFEPEKEAIVSSEEKEGVIGMEWGSAEFKNIPTKPVLWRAISDSEVELSLDADTAPAFLVYSMTAVPGWKATLDGKSVRIYRTDGAIFGLNVPPGKHEIKLIYRPNAFVFGYYLSLVSTLGLAIWSCYLLLIGVILRQRQIRSIQSAVLQDKSRPSEKIPGR